VTDNLASSNGRKYSQITVRRLSAFADRDRKYTIHLDNEDVGTIADGQIIKIPAEAGLHEIHATIDWCRSNKMHLEVRAGVSMEVLVSPRASGLLFAIYPIFMILPSRYLKLRCAASPNH